MWTRSNRSKLPGVRTWPLTGRNEELDAVARGLEFGGNPRGIAICGHPGVGKTRLAKEVAHLAAGRGWRVRWILGTEASRIIPMGALAQWTDTLCADPLQVVRQVIGSLQRSADHGPLLLVVDDAHLLDELSAFVVLQCATRGIATVVATVRMGDHAPEAITALWRGQHVDRLELQPLSRQESADLVSAVLSGPVAAETCAELWEVTRGNVLYLRELVEQEAQARRLVEDDGQWRWIDIGDVSPSLADIVEFQIGQGISDLHDALDLVAVAEPIEYRHLINLVDTALIDEAERRGLISMTGTGADIVVGVGHPLYGEVRRARAGHLRLERLRGRVAEELSTEPDIDTIRVAQLWLDSDLEPNVELMLRASQQATVRLDLVLAERFAAAAVDGQGGPEAQMAHAHLLMLLNHGRQADRVLRSVSKSSVSANAWGRLVHLRAACLMWPLRQPDSAASLIDQAIAETSDAAASMQLRAARSVQWAMAARPDDVLAELADVDVSTLPAVAAMDALWALTIAHGDHGAPQLAATAACRGYRQVSDTAYALYQGLAIAECHVSATGLAGLIEESTAGARQIRQHCAHAIGVARPMSHGVHGLAALFAGDLNAARVDLEAAFDEFMVEGPMSGALYRFSVVYAEVAARSGDRPTASALHEKIDHYRHPTFQYVEPDRLLAEAWYAAMQGHVTEAQRNAHQAAEFARVHSQHAREVYSLQTALQFGAASPDLTRRVRELAATVSGPRATVVHDYAVAAEKKDPCAIQSVALRFEEIGDRLAAADAYAQAGRIFTEHNFRGSALGAINRVSAIVRSTGAVSPAITAAMHPLPLSSREREVAQMASSGMSNRLIAQSLRISQRTVEGHIYRTCSKLGAAGRRDLAAILNDGHMGVTDRA